MWSLSLYGRCISVVLKYFNTKQKKNHSVTILKKQKPKTIEIFVQKKTVACCYNLEYQKTQENSKKKTHEKIQKKKLIKKFKEIIVCN